jgi:hypothetical protein
MFLLSGDIRQEDDTAVSTLLPMSLLSGVIRLLLDAIIVLVLVSCIFYYELSMKVPPVVREQSNVRRGGKQI